MKEPACTHYRRTLLWVLAAGLVLGAAGCRKGKDLDDDDDDEAGTPAAAVQAGPSGSVSLKAEAARAAGVSVAPLAPAEIRPSRSAVGVVEDPGPLLAAAAAFSDARAQFEAADAALARSKAEADRARLLNRDGRNLGAKELEAAESAWRADAASAEAARAALAVRRAELRRGWGPVVAGWIESGAADYKALLDGTELLVRVALPPGEAAGAAPDRAFASLPGGARGEFSFVSPTPAASPEFQAPGYLYLAKARGGLLPGLNLAVSLPETGAPAGGLLVPVSAVVWWQGIAWVYVDKPEGTFTRRAIPTDRPVPGGYLVPAGAIPGPVAVAGAASLLTEEFKPAADND